MCKITWKTSVLLYPALQSHFSLTLSSLFPRGYALSPLFSASAARECIISEESKFCLWHACQFKACPLEDVLPILQASTALELKNIEILSKILATLIAWRRELVLSNSPVSAELKARLATAP